MKFEDFLTLLAALEGFSKVQVHVNIDLLVDDIGLPPDPDPVPVPTTSTFHVTVQTSNARFAQSYNAKGHPIMTIFPANNSETKDRVQFHVGTEVKVLQTPVIADGAEVYYSIVGSVDKYHRELFVRALDGAVQAILEF